MSPDFIEATRRLTEQVERMERDQRRILEIVQPPRIHEMLTQLSRQIDLAGWVGGLSSLGLQVPKSLLDSLTINPAKFGLGGILERGAETFLEQWEESDRRLALLAPTAEALGRRGWTLPVRWGLTDFLDVVEKIPPEDLDEGWVGYYVADDGKEFEELVQALAAEQFLEPWRRMLDGAVHCYRTGWYETAVPALFVCFDGAFAAATDRSDRHASVRTTAVEFRKSAERTVRILCWASIQGFAHVVYGSREFSEDPPTVVNRHWVQHGRAIPPKPQADCLRLLQALETLTLIGQPEYEPGDEGSDADALV